MFFNSIGRSSFGVHKTQNTQTEMQGMWSYFYFVVISLIIYVFA